MLLPRGEKNIIVPTGVADGFNRTAERNICQTTGIGPMLFDRDKISCFALFRGKIPALVSLLAVTLIAGCSAFSSNKSSQVPETPETAAGIGSDAGLAEVTHSVIVKMRNNDLLSPGQPTDRRICFLGVNDVNGREVPELSREVRKQFSEDTSYRFIDDATLERALEKSGVKRNDMFIPSKRQQWVAALGEDFDYIISAHIVRTGDPDHGVPSQEVVNFEVYSMEENTVSHTQGPLRGVYSLASAERKKVLGIF